MNGKKARKLKKVAKTEFEATDEKSQHRIYRDLKKMYKNGEIKVK